jgi:hypothetical protein
VIWNRNRHEHFGPKPTLDLLSIGILEEQLGSPSFSMIAVYTVVAIPILPATAELYSAAAPDSISKYGFSQTSATPRPMRYWYVSS